jgi:hypothetical protein
MAWVHPGSGQLSLAPDFAPNSTTVVDLSPVPPGWTIGLELLFYLNRAVHCTSFDMVHRGALCFLTRVSILDDEGRIFRVSVESLTVSVRARIFLLGRAGVSALF